MGGARFSHFVRPPGRLCQLLVAALKQYCVFLRDLVSIRGLCFFLPAESSMYVHISHDFLHQVTVSQRAIYVHDRGVLHFFTARPSLRRVHSFVSQHLPGPLFFLTYHPLAAVHSDPPLSTCALARSLPPPLAVPASEGAVFASIAQEEDESSLEPSPSGGRSVLYYKGLGRHSAGEE